MQKRQGKKVTEFNKFQDGCTITCLDKLDRIPL